MCVCVHGMDIHERVMRSAAVTSSQLRWRKNRVRWRCWASWVSGKWKGWHDVLLLTAGKL